MEELNKTQIRLEILRAISKMKDYKLHCKEKRSGSIVTIKIIVEEPEIFIDKDGIKWVRA